MAGRDQDYLTLKERLEILFGIRGTAGERAVRLKELKALEERVARLREKTAGRDSAWRTPTLLNGWVDYGGSYGPPQYRRLSSGLVVVEGLVMNGTMGTTVFTLPSGFRPRVRLVHHTRDSSATATARLDIHSSGAVQAIEGATAWFSLACVFYAGGS